MSHEYRLLQSEALAHEPIVALSTAPGRSAVAVLRLSGDANSVDGILEAVLGQVPRHPPQALRRARLLCPKTGSLIDDILVVRFVAPRSYTGEDLVEFHLHGNPLLVERGLGALLEAGARLAGPGEFTRRAVEGGKMDLLGAEALFALISAESEAGLRVAQRQLGGELSKRLRKWHEALLAAAVALEALIDFPEEVDEAELRSELDGLPSLRVRMAELASTAESGRRAVSGFLVVLCGPPNAGKSSVFNALLGHDRAMVSPMAGTTRDLVSEHLQIGPWAFRLEDTAGEREAQDPIEAEGVQRSRAAQGRADRRLFVRNGMALKPGELPPAGRDGDLAVATRADLLSSGAKEGLRRSGWLLVGVPSGEGLEELRGALVRCAGESGTQEGPILHTQRQQRALAEAAAAVARAERAGGDEPAIAAVELREAGRSLEALVGQWSDAAVLDALFERFCIGK